MTDGYCKICYRALTTDRDTCFGCERRPSTRVAGLLVAIAIPLLIAGMLALNGRLCAVGAAIAAAGVLLRLVRL